MSWLRLANTETNPLDKPITVQTLAHAIADRRGDSERGRSTHATIQFWISRGLYDIRLASWPVLNTRMTTMRKYLEFRRKVAQERKRRSRELLQHLQQKRGLANGVSPEKENRALIAG